MSEIAEAPTHGIPVHAEPKTVPFVEQVHKEGLAKEIKVPYQPGKEAFTSTAKVSWDEMQKKVGNLVAEMKGRHPDETDMPLIELIGDLFGGPYRLDQGLPRLENGEAREGTQQRKEVNARAQHAIVHAILHAGSSEATIEFIDEIYDMTATFENIAMSSTEFHGEASIFWDGVISEINVIKSLTEQGYAVYLPDYTEDPYDADGEKKEHTEILDWDVRGGTDLVVEKDGYVLLVDAKGRVYIKSETGEESTQKRHYVQVDLEKSYMRGRVNNVSELPESLQELTGSLNPKDIREVKMIIPCAYEHVNTLKQSTNGVGINKRKALADFGTFRQDYLAEGLVEPLDRYIKSQQGR